MGPNLFLIFENGCQILIFFKNRYNRLKDHEKETYMEKNIELKNFLLPSQQNFSSYKKFCQAKSSNNSILCA